MARSSVPATACQGGRHRVRHWQRFCNWMLRAERHRLSASPEQGSENAPLLGAPGMGGESARNLCPTLSLVRSWRQHGVCRTKTLPMTLRAVCLSSRPWGPLSVFWGAS